MLPRGSRAPGSLRDGTQFLRNHMADVEALKAEVAASSATLVQCMSMDEPALAAALQAAGLPPTSTRADLRGHVLTRMDELMSQIPEDAFDSTVLDDTEPAVHGDRPTAATAIKANLKPQESTTPGKRRR